MGEDFNPWNEEIRLLEIMLKKYDSIQEGGRRAKKRFLSKRSEERR